MNKQLNFHVIAIKLESESVEYIGYCNSIPWSALYNHLPAIDRIAILCNLVFSSDCKTLKPSIPIGRMALLCLGIPV